MITIAHVITGLDRGGAEGVLARLVTSMDHAKFRNLVISLRDDGVWGGKLRAEGIEVHCLGIRDLFGMLAGRAKLKRLVQAAAPDVVQGWLYHGDLLATLATPPSTALAWNLRNSDLAASGRTSWRVLVALLSRLSTRPDVVIANAQANLNAHIERGYRPRRTHVIPNGVDTESFKLGACSRASARERFGLPDQAFLIGMPARYDGFKDHRTFLAAAALLSQTGLNVEFALAGTDIGEANATLVRLVDEAGLREGVHLLGETDDMPALYAAFDMVTLTSSHGEGFPNVVAEAMASGKPIVATDVGDVRQMIEDASLITPPRAPDALAKAWRAIVELGPDGRAALGARLRAHAEASFGMDAATHAYEALYADLAGGRR